jgi:hypothetical protein
VIGTLPPHSLAATSDESLLVWRSGFDLRDVSLSDEHHHLLKDTHWKRVTDSSDYERDRGLGAAGQLRSCMYALGREETHQIYHGVIISP